MSREGIATLEAHPVNGSTSWFDRVDLGDVVQNGVTGNGHSVIVVESAAVNETPTYAGHSDAALGASLQDMVVDARNRGAEYLYTVRFN